MRRRAAGRTSPPAPSTGPPRQDPRASSTPSPGSRRSRSPARRRCSQLLRPRFASFRSASRFSASRRSSQNPSRNAFRSLRPSGRARYRRRVPFRRSLTSPASFRTFRCWEIAGPVISNWPAISPADSSPSRTSDRIRRRCGSAIALSAASMAIFKQILLEVSTYSRHTAQRDLHAPGRDSVPRGSRGDRRLRGVPEDRRLVGAPAHVSGLREDRLLRQLAEQARDGALPRDLASDHPLGRARRGLVVVLRRRDRARARLSWPALPYEEWKDTRDTLHMQLQVVGKVRLALSPFEPQWANVPLYLTARGLWTSTIPHPTGEDFDIDIDLIDHTAAVRTGAGRSERVSLQQPVAAFYGEMMAALERAGVPVEISTLPSEVPDPIPFPEDTVHSTYDTEAVTRFWRVLLAVESVLREHRARFRGKAPPVQLWWGTLDLAMSLYTGRDVEPPAEGGIIMRLGGDAELFCAGFWPG